MAKVILDAEVFKALASPTRLAVLRALDERRKTVTELARALELNKATVHEHLALLVATGLVKKRDDEGRKWIYYELTWSGERLLHPQETTSFMVMLGLSVAAAGGGVALLGRSLGLWWEGHQLQPSDEGDGPFEVASDEPGGSGTEDTGPQGEGAGSTDTSTAQEDADGVMLRAPEQTEAKDTDGGAALFDDDGLLGLLLLLTAILLAVGAAVMRRAGRGGKGGAEKAPEGGLEEAPEGGLDEATSGGADDGEDGPLR